MNALVLALTWRQLTIVPAVMCFDDAFLANFLALVPRNGGRIVRERLTRLYRAEKRARSARSMADYFEPAPCLHLVLFFLMIALSKNAVMNLVSPNQVMNTSFDRLRLLNSYGAFGTVNKERMEIVLEATMDDFFATSAARWEEYNFKCKPGGLTQRPCVVSPFHYRLDWLMWFAATGTVNQYPWLLSLVYKLLSDPSQVAHLMGEPLPFGGRNPKAVRAQLYHYEFAKNVSGDLWWERTLIREYFGPLTTENPSLKKFLTARGYIRTTKEEGRRQKRRQRRKTEL